MFLFNIKFVVKNLIPILTVLTSLFYSTFSVNGKVTEIAEWDVVGFGETPASIQEIDSGTALVIIVVKDNDIILTLNNVANNEVVSNFLLKNIYIDRDFNFLGKPYVKLIGETKTANSNGNINIFLSKEEGGKDIIILSNNNSKNNLSIAGQLLHEDMWKKVVTLSISSKVNPNDVNATLAEIIEAYLNDH